MNLDRERKSGTDVGEWESPSSMIWLSCEERRSKRRLEFRQEDTMRRNARLCADTPPVMSFYLLKFLDQDVTFTCSRGWLLLVGLRILRRFVRWSVYVRLVLLPLDWMWLRWRDCWAPHMFTFACVSVCGKRIETVAWRAPRHCTPLHSPLEFSTQPGG